MIQMEMEGVVYHKLITHTDERGYFREVLRKDNDFFDGFGQWSHSKMDKGVIKAWHIHQIQTDYWYVVAGKIKAVLLDLRQDQPTYRKTAEYFLGDDCQPAILKIPPGVAHGLKVLSEQAHLLYITSHVYNPRDEGRLIHNDPNIEYNWLEGAKIK